MKRPELKDPMRAGLIEELRALRRGSGNIETRLGALTWTVDSLGHGSLERAVERLHAIRDGHGTDAATGIGALFWLADYGEHQPNASLEQRLDAYGATFACDPRTALRRSDRGIQALAGLIRDYNETERPMGVVSVFQSGPHATVVGDLWMSWESFREPEVQINGDVIEREPSVLHHHDGDPEGRYRVQLIFEDLALNIAATPYEPCLSVRIIWGMPVMPVWRLHGWVADPGFMMTLQTFRERACEVGVMLRQKLHSDT